MWQTATTFYDNLKAVCKDFYLKGVLDTNKEQVLCLSGHNKKGANRTMKIEGLCENKGICLAPE